VTDPYVAFAQLAGAVPAGGTKDEYPKIRNQYKTCLLSANYGISARGLSVKAGISIPKAQTLLNQHRRIFRKFWDWKENYTDEHLLMGKTHTRHDWRLSTINVKPRSLGNFPIQSCGSEILQLSACLIEENGIELLATIHDAVLIGSTLEFIDRDVQIAIKCMERASEFVLGTPIGVESFVVRYPDRYVDERGSEIWNHILRVLKEVESN
jgi:DNA polymerase I-like protein with 3'-5' exonuclease and polymerase domains